MFEFNKTKISSFYSLGQVELEFKNGLYLVKGYNKDVQSIDNVSNGAGKTSLFNAIYQGLYNKNLKDKEGVVSSVNNKFLQKPYKIAIDFKKGNTKYKIINDRNTMDIQIIKDNKNIAPKGIQNALRLIKEQVIGFPFEIFTSLTYLNSSTLDNIIELTNKNNILYQFFEVDKLNNFQKKLQEFLKSKKDTYKFLEMKISSVKDMLNFLNNEQQDNEYDLLEQINKYQQELINLETKSEFKILKKYQQELDLLKTKIIDNKERLIQKKLETDNFYKEYKSLKSGVCPICYQSISDDLVRTAKHKFENSKKFYYELKDIVDELEKNKLELERKIFEIENKLNSQKTLLLSKINELQGQIKQLNYYQELKNKKEKLQEELLILENEQQLLDNEIQFLNNILKLLKSGVLLNKYLEKYISLLKINLDFYKQFTTFTFNIRVSIGKKGLVYRFVENGVVKTFNQLSSGEKTRISFLILISTIRALEQLSGIEINFLVIDEILGVLDEEGLDFIKKIISHLKDNKAIFIITHHNEIEESDVDYILNVIKENNISKIELKELK